jgi:hypothetical protein
MKIPTNVKRTDTPPRHIHQAVLLCSQTYVTAQAEGYGK